MKKIHLWAFLQGIGFFPGGWRHPDAQPKSVWDLEFYKRLGQRLEGACFDAIVFGDQLNGRDIAGKTPPHLAAPTLDPITLLTVIASVTKRVGLVGTISTTYHEPYALSTLLATLDTFSGGRAGWNIVTTAVPASALNFGETDLMEKSLRYARAEEFVDLCRKFWDSTLPGAPEVDHQGKFFTAKGRLPVPRPVQGHPVLVQAGQSADGREFAARVAEAIFCPAPTLEAGREYRDDIRQRMPKYGRHPDEATIMPGLGFVLGSTEAEAKARHAELLDLAHDPINIDYLGEVIGYDLSQHPINGPVPLDQVIAHCEFPTIDVKKTLTPFVEKGLSIAEIARKFARTPRGHNIFVGTPEQMADYMQQWIEAGACDGFTLQPGFLPVEIDTFIDEVAPILKRRGILRSTYEGPTLRDHLGLAHK